MRHDSCAFFDYDDFICWNIFKFLLLAAWPADLQAVNCGGAA